MRKNHFLFVIIFLHFIVTLFLGYKLHKVEKTQAIFFRVRADLLDHQMKHTELGFFYEDLQYQSKWAWQLAIDNCWRLEKIKPKQSRHNWPWKGCNVMHAYKDFGILKFFSEEMNNE